MSTVDRLIMLRNRYHPVAVLINRFWSFSTVHRSIPFRNGEERWTVKPGWSEIRPVATRWSRDGHGKFMGCSCDGHGTFTVA